MNSSIHRHRRRRAAGSRFPGRPVAWALLTLVAAPWPTVAEERPTAETPPGGAPCRIEIVERESGWPVPLVELRTTHQARFVSDNAGVIALDLPEAMGQETWFDVRGHGYGVAADGFGNRGVRLVPRPGATLRVEVERSIIARRLGRLTGAGLFAEDERSGGGPRVAERRGVFGCDSVRVATHRGRLHWAWGDTTVPRYPLGVFDTTGATTGLAPLTAPVPPLALSFDMFVTDGARPRGICPMPGSGPTWIGGLISLPDASGTDRLVATYVKIRAALEPYEAGLCVWDDGAAVFRPHRLVWARSDAAPLPPPLPDGHPVRYRDPAGGERVVFGDPLPTLECAATFEAWENPAAWLALVPQPSIARRDGAAVVPHRGSIAWNGWRRRWITVFTEKFGSPSALGEVWYAEAPAPTGPWAGAVKVLSHDNYSFYNPRIDAELTAADGPVVLFEGTYSATFAADPVPTPRYDYNQVLYRLDLDDPRLASDPSTGD
ncbi:MAG: hypothetical protein ACKOCW_00025 [Planctomycetaceae bacterium]